MCQTAKGFGADVAQAYVLMAIHARSQWDLRVIAMNQLYLIESEGAINRSHGLLQALLSRYVVTRGESMGRIEAYSNGQTIKPGDQVRYLIELAAYRVPLAGGVLNQDRQGIQ